MPNPKRVKIGICVFFLRLTAPHFKISAEFVENDINSDALIAPHQNDPDTEMYQYMENDTELEDNLTSSGLMNRSYHVAIEFDTNGDNLIQDENRAIEVSELQHKLETNGKRALQYWKNILVSVKFENNSKYLHLVQCFLKNCHFVCVQ